MVDRDVHYTNFENDKYRLAREQRAPQTMHTRSLSPMTDGDIYDPYSSTTPYNHMNDTATFSSIGTYDHNRSNYRSGNQSSFKNSPAEYDNPRPHQRNYTPKQKNNNQQTPTPRKKLDLKQAMNMDIIQNDEAFQIVARYIIEQLNRERIESRGETNNQLNIDPSLCYNFIDAVQIRMKRFSRMKKEDGYVYKLTKYCHDLGLGYDEVEENPLLMDRKMLEDDVSHIH